MCALAQSLTQFQCSGQSSDDSDRVGRVGAELMERREKRIPLVFQLYGREERQELSGDAD